MARSPRRAFSGPQRVRRQTSWTTGAEGILSPASTAVSGFPTTALPLVSGLTIVRTRGVLSLVLLTSSVAQGGFQGAAGLCVVSAKAAGIGATAVPGPLTEDDWEGWMWHQHFVLKGPSATITDMGSARVLNFTIDSKAMRKIESDTALVGMLETVEVGTATMHAELRTRVLLKLP